MENKKLETVEESGLPNEKDLELLYILVNNALDGKHLKLELIRCQEELSGAKVILKTTEDIIKKLKTVAKNIYMLYLNKLENPKLSLVKNLDEAELLVEFKKIEYAADFYEKDVKKLKHIIHEFRVYRFYHKYKVWVKNEYRPEEELVDYTTLPFTWF